MIKNSLFILIKKLSDKGYLKFLSDRVYLKLLFWLRFNKRLDLNNPLTFNEKIQWLKLYDRKDEYKCYVDKYEVRNIIKEKIGEEYLIPLYSVYDTPNQIKWEDLPESFVLKCTHGSGANIICKNKNELNIKKASLLLRKWYKKNWFWYGRAYPYKNIKPRIICEKYISDLDITPDDYKVLCFNGKAKLIEVHHDRFGNHTQDFYDINWNKTKITQSNPSDTLLPKPKCLEEMIRLSETLAEGFIHIRIDWYIVNNKLYFGEITFYDGSGFTPFDNYEDDNLLGSWIKI